MYDVSFIISIDSSFEMTNNFFENFLNDYVNSEGDKFWEIQTK